ncbi:DUF4231 domain-containing protein [Rhodococcus maanshanensis]|uniref:DUF4231 domain-containing protein n=1 Tax=Rhodococcus maanshanensis TaxID=183556 RepID=UPI0022B5B5B4|nr:DUF4231 domain-containing protein [Rhodococcus maanshanensis]MCZ4554751.1 DUF4231 domain-containing protein [Rhodococcus maanshanensis]
MAVSRAVPTERATSDEEALVASIWVTRVRWSLVADRLKRRIDIARAAVLYLGAAGAIAATSTATFLRTADVARVLVAAFGAVCLAIAAVVTAFLLTPDAVRRWTRARAASEGIKQLVLRFRAGAVPFDGADAPARLAAEVAEIEEAVEDLLASVAEFAEFAEFGEDDAEVRDAVVPGPMTPGDYVRDRVQSQITEYYRPRACAYAGRARRLRRVALGLSVATASVAAVVTVLAGDADTSAGDQPSSGLAPWVAVLTTLGGAVAAHRPAAGTTTSR